MRLAICDYFTPSDSPVRQIKNTSTNPSYDNSDYNLVHLKPGKTCSLDTFHGRLLLTPHADRNHWKRLKYCRQRVPYMYYHNSSASLNIELLRAGDIEAARATSEIHVLFVESQLQGLNERFVVPCTTFTRISSVEM